MNEIHKKTGSLEVICGPMFSGKTEELIRRVRRAEYAHLPVQVFKPEIDDRYDQTDVVSHNSLRHQGVSVRNSQMLCALVKDDTRVVAIDEVQFFDDGIVDVCQKLADDGKRVIVAGLDQDYRGLPFGPVPQLLAVAEYITKNLAICVVCGNPAGRTQRLDPTGEQIIIGAQDLYEARCRNCHEVND